MNTEYFNLLVKLKRDILSYHVDHDQTDDYIEGFDDGINYAIDKIDSFQFGIEQESEEQG